MAKGVRLLEILRCSAAPLLPYAPKAEFGRRNVGLCALRGPSAARALPLAMGEASNIDMSEYRPAEFV
jgi:hypothetical protein